MNGSSFSDISIEVSYAVPVISAVIAPVKSLPSSESYASPFLINNAPKLQYPMPIVLNSGLTCAISLTGYEEASFKISQAIAVNFTAF